MLGKIKIRPVIVFVHRWVGLFLALFLIIEGVTGSILCFRSDLTTFFDPLPRVERPAGAVRLPPGELADHADAELAPQAQVAYFFPTSKSEAQGLRVTPRLDPRTGKAFAIEYGEVYVNPYTGQLLSKAPFEGYTRGVVRNIMPFVYKLHTELSLGGFGAWLLGIVALLWTLDSFWAVYLTFPAKFAGFWRKWRSSWLVKWPSSTFRLNFDFHRAGGLWLWTLLFVFAWSSVELTEMPVYDAVTGAIMPYEGFTGLIAKLPHHDPNVRPKLTWSQGEVRGLNLLRDIGRQRGFTVGNVTSYAYLADEGLYSLEVSTSKTFPAFRNFGIYYDGDTGKLFMVLDPAGPKLGDGVTEWLRGLHLVEDPVDYFPYRLLVFCFGFFLAGISGTGVYIWLRKRRGRLAQADARKRQAE